MSFSSTRSSVGVPFLRAVRACVAALLCRAGPASMRRLRRSAAASAARLRVGGRAVPARWRRRCCGSAGGCSRRGLVAPRRSRLGCGSRGRRFGRAAVPASRSRQRCRASRSRRLSGSLRLRRLLGLDRSQRVLGFSGRLRPAFVSAGRFSAGFSAGLFRFVLRRACLLAVQCFRYRLPNFPHSPACQGRERQRLRRLPCGWRANRALAPIDSICLSSWRSPGTACRELQPLLQFQILLHPSAAGIQNQDRTSFRVSRFSK